MRKYHFLIAALVLLVDRLTKLLVASKILVHNSVDVLPFFRLTHVHNKGAAFGLGADSASQWTGTMLIFFSIAALIVVSALLWKNSHTLSSTAIGLALIMGGALGNLWDRIVNEGRVVDFLDFFVGNYHWPAFNIADSAIVLGALLLVSEILFSKSAEEQTRTVTQAGND